MRGDEAGFGRREGCGGRFHVTVTAMSVLLAKAMVVWFEYSTVEEKEGERKKGDAAS